MTLLLLAAATFLYLPLYVILGLAKKHKKDGPVIKNGFEEPAGLLFPIEVRRKHAARRRSPDSERSIR